MTREDLLETIKAILQSEKPDGLKFEVIVKAIDENVTGRESAYEELKKSVAEVTARANEQLMVISGKTALINELREDRDLLGEQLERSKKGLRDEYAARILGGIMAHSSMSSGLWEAHDKLVKKSFQIADEAMKQRGS